VELHGGFFIADKRKHSFSNFLRPYYNNVKREKLKF